MHTGAHMTAADTLTRLTCPTVEALHKQLDLTPGDHTLRLVLLAELAPGYRALARCNRTPDTGYSVAYIRHHVRDTDWYGPTGLEWRSKTPDRSALPADWFTAGCSIDPEGHRLGLGLTPRPHLRRRAEDWAARGFARLPEARRAELLRGPAG